jgi:hypothetical protein
VNLINIPRVPVLYTQGITEACVQNSPIGLGLYREVPRVPVFRCRGGLVITEHVSLAETL